jgi:hypothetical protein
MQEAGNHRFNGLGVSSMKKLICSECLFKGTIKELVDHMEKTGHAYWSNTEDIRPDDDDIEVKLTKEDIQKELEKRHNEAVVDLLSNEGKLD